MEATVHARTPGIEPQPRRPGRLVGHALQDQRQTLLGLQRSVGNAAVAQMVTVQRCGGHTVSGCPCEGDGFAGVQRDVITIPEVKVEAVPPASLRSGVGTVGYYKQRNEDYVSRMDPGEVVPDYYLGYGDKYAHRFTEVLKPQLSKAGQAWVDRTFVLLQSKIEDRRDQNPWAFAKLERDTPAFRSFAYGTHPAAYLDGGICDMPDKDLAKIAGTPDLMDILTLDGAIQVAETGLGCLVVWQARVRTARPGEIDPYMLYGL